MRYVRTNGNKQIVAYPYSIAQLRRDHPYRSFSSFTDDVLAAHSVQRVHDTPQPDHDPMTQVVIEGSPTLKRGKWVQHWIVQDLPSEQAERAIYAKRAGMRLSRAQFALHAARAGLITAEEAEAWAGGVSLPEAVRSAFDNKIESEAERLAARINALAASEVNRVNPIIDLLQAQLQLSDEQVDALFSG